MLVYDSEDTRLILLYFLTAVNAPSVLPLWIILVIALVGSLTVVILLLLLLISCCYRRRSDRKINLASNIPG